MEIVVGCCGQAGLSWSNYQSIFPAIEIQSTFYKLPKIETAKKWRQQTPKLRFSVKAFQAITHPSTSPTWKRAGSQRPKEHLDAYGHLQSNQIVYNAWKATQEICRALDAEACLIQLPPSFEMKKEHVDNLVMFFSNVDRETTIVIEFRHPSWFKDERAVRELLQTLEVTHVVDPLVSRPAYIAGCAYYRLHGRVKAGARLDYNYKYSNEQIAEIKHNVLQFGGDRAYIFFNNLYMKDDALRLLEIL